MYMRWLTRFMAVKVHPVRALAQQTAGTMKKSYPTAVNQAPEPSGPEREPIPRSTSRRGAFGRILARSMSPVNDVGHDRVVPNPRSAVAMTREGASYNFAPGSARGTRAERGA